MAAWLDPESGDRDLKPLEGLLVKIDSLPEDLSPNEDTAADGARPISFNGHCGRCLGWDEEEQKYVVQTFGGLVAGVPEENLEEWEPGEAEEGGFDVAWPTNSPQSQGAFASMVTETLSQKGYCVVQMFTSPAIRQAALQEAERLPAAQKLRAEFEEGYLGKDNVTKCGELEPDMPTKMPEQALEFCDRELSNLGVLLTPSLEETFGYNIHDRSEALVRTPFPGGLWERLPPLDDRDMREREAENFMSWTMRRKLCMMYLVNSEGGTLSLAPAASLGLEPVSLPMATSRVVLFRHDMMSYSYQPNGSSVALQMWLQEPPQAIEFRELATPPGTQNMERIHIAGATERFPANCADCHMTLALFTAGTDAQQYCPSTRFDPDLYCIPGDRDAPLSGKAYTMHGSFCSHDVLVSFDNQFFGMADAEAERISPAQRWVMEVGFECLHKAGWTKPDLMNQRIGTFIGDSGSEWNQIALVQDQYSKAAENNSVLISRLSYCLGMNGPNISVDTACSASLVALNVAAHWMRRYIHRDDRTNPMGFQARHQQLQGALCQGILCMLHPGAWIGECSSTMLSPRGRCFTFDGSADGFIRGEGSCAAYLECRDDRDSDAAQRSLGTVLSTASNQDGRSASLTAPSGPAQQACIRISLRESGLRPADVQGTECHGTGTALGDPIEVGANKSVMLGHRDDPYFHCTAKAHVGHEEANAGLCGFLKIMLMLNCGIFTPNPHLRALNPHLDVHAYPVYFNNELSCTLKPNNVYGISSFGFGGSNSRADVWTDAEKGVYAGGRATVLTKDEALQWVTTIEEGAGGEGEMPSFVAHHKPGH